MKLFTTTAFVFGLMSMTLALGGCGNTVMGIGADIVTMGEGLMTDVNIEETTNAEK